MIVHFQNNAFSSTKMLNNEIHFIFFNWVFIAVHGLFSRDEQGLLSSRNAQASLCRGFSCCGAPALECEGFSSCSPWAHWLCSNLA